MANYRLDNSNTNQYQENRKIIAERGSQPLTAPLGNYSLDRQGRPILPSHKEMVTEEDFNHQNNTNTQQSNNIYYLNDYTPTLSQNDYNQEANSTDYYNEYSSGTTNYRLDQKKYQPEANVNHKSSRKSQPNFKNIYQKRPQSLTRGLPQGKVKIFSVYLLILFSMIWAGWQIMPFNKVNQLLVQGHSYLTVETILQGVDIGSMDTVEEILDYRLELENHILSNHPLIEDVTISRDSWEYLTFSIKEHEIVGKIQQDHLVYPLLSNGYVMETPVELETLQSEAYYNLPLIEGDFSSTTLEKLASSIEQIDPSIISQFSSIQSAEESNQSDHIIVNMEDGNQIYAVIPTFAQKVNFYPNIVKQLEGRQGVIDLEVGAYFTPYSNFDNSIKLDNN